MSEDGEGGGEGGEKRRRRRSGPVTKGGDARAAKQFHTKVKTARGRKYSSKLWLERQLNDPYVARARQEGYRSRAAYKLIELDDRFGLIKPGMRVADLGAAPGGWAQVAVKRGAAHVAGVDLLEMADEKQAREAGFAIGFVGPHIAAARNDLTLIVDPDVARGGFWVTGANKSDHHVKHFNWKRDVLDHLPLPRGEGRG